MTAIEKLMLLSSSCGKGLCLLLRRFEIAKIVITYIYTRIGHTHFFVKRLCFDQRMQADTPLYPLLLTVVHRRKQ